MCNIFFAYFYTITGGFMRIAHFMIAGLVMALGSIAIPAHAYVGPGPGLTMIGSLIGLVGSIVVALLMIILWPLRLYMKKKKAANMAKGTNEITPPSALE